MLIMLAILVAVLALGASLADAQYEGRQTAHCVYLDTSVCQMYQDQRVCQLRV